MSEYKMKVEAAATRFNVIRADLDYLIAHEDKPGMSEMLSAGDDYDYFGSLAEHECLLARLATVTDADSLVDVCIGLRDCGYDDPSVVEKLKLAAHVVRDYNLIDAIEEIMDQEVLIDSILDRYDAGNTGVVNRLMDGSMMVRFPRRVLRGAA